jgi:hypothetical protein
LQAVDQNPPTRNLTAPRRNLAAIGSATDGDPTPTDETSPVESGRTWYRVASWPRAGSFFTGRPAALENQGAFAPFDAAVRIDVPSASAAPSKTTPQGRNSATTLGRGCVFINTRCGKGQRRRAACRPGAACRHWNWHTFDKQISRLFHSQHRNAEHGAARRRRPCRRRSRASWPANM